MSFGRRFAVRCPPAYRTRFAAPVSRLAVTVRLCTVLARDVVLIQHCVPCRRTERFPGISRAGRRNLFQSDRTPTVTVGLSRVPHPRGTRRVEEGQLRTARGWGTRLRPTVTVGVRSL